MSLYDDALAAGRPQNLSPDMLQQIMRGELEGYSIVRDTTTGGYYNGTDYVPGPGRDLIYGPQEGGTWGTQSNAVYDTQGNFVDMSSGDSTALQTAKFAAMSAGAYYAAGAANGLESSMASGGADAATQAAWGQGAGLGGDTLSAMGATPGAAGVSGMTAAEVTAAQAAAEAAATQQAGLQTVEIVGSKLPAAAGPGITAAEVAAPIGAELTMEQLGSTTLDPEQLGGLDPVETIPEDVVDPTNYSNEGRNYPTTESTQGPGGSPVNSTSQFPGTPINDVNGNPVTQPTYDSNGNQIIPPVNGTNGTPGTQLPGNQLPGGTNPLGTNDFKNLFDVLSGLYGLKLANDAVEKSDPFGPYREGYAKKLQALEANPGTLRNTPGFFTGQDMINRSMASKGYLGSGNQAAALQRFGGDFYHQEANRLAGLAGASIQPGNTYFNAADLAGRSLSNIGYGLSPYMQPGGPR